MKTLKTGLFCGVLSLLTSFLSFGQENKIPSLVIGTLSAYPTMVQTGTKPTLTWNIQYPSNISNAVMFSPSGEATLKQKSIVEVSPILLSSKGVSKESTPIEITMKVDGSSYFQLFYGRQEDVRPSKTLYTKNLSPETKINFGARYVVNGSYSTFYSTQLNKSSTIVLRNGDKLPFYSSSKLKAEMKPYLDYSGAAKIGPLSSLICFEFSTELGSDEYDYQDVVLLVDFSKKSNNGHGNNVDGVDSSNPSNGNGGPNGVFEPVGSVDDEKK